MPPESVDLIVTDPPYGMRYRSRRLGRIVNDDHTNWFRWFAAEAHRVLKDNTHLYVFCNDYCISDFRRALLSAGFMPKRTLVWVKNCHTRGDLRGDYAPRTEFILFAHKGRLLLNGKRDSNVLSFPRIHTPRHPAEKPESLIRYLILKSSNDGEVVLDPFVGSGTTCRVAKDLNRRYVGIEIDPRYAAMARRRLKGQESWKSIRPIQRRSVKRSAPLR